MKKVGPNLKEIRLKLNRNWIPVWLRKPSAFRATTKMPDFRFNDEQIQSISRIPVAVGARRSAAQAQTRQRLAWQRTVRIARLPRLPFHRGRAIRCKAELSPPT